MTNEAIQSMVHEIMGLTDDITGLMIWITETIEPIMKENEQLKLRLKKAKEMLPAYISEKI